MPYAVVQKVLELPDVERLKAAFRGFPGLTPVDAYTIGKDAFGILVKGYTYDNANRMVSALQAQGIETEVVDESLLPRLPQGPNTTRIDVNPGGLTVYDAYNRAVPVECKNVVLIAAGKVPLSEFKRVRTETPSTEFDPSHFGRGGYGVRPRMNVEYETREERQEHLLLEIILQGTPARYSIDVGRSAHLLFRGLGERKTADLKTNLTLLVQELLRFAPHAAINQGAYYFRENSAQAFVYPSKNAFYEEMIWLLWKLQQAGGKG
jgi:hypothetical protein